MVQHQQVVLVKSQSFRANAECAPCQTARLMVLGCFGLRLPGTWLLALILSGTLTSPFLKHEIGSVLNNSQYHVCGVLHFV